MRNKITKLLIVVVPRRTAGDGWGESFRGARETSEPQMCNAHQGISRSRVRAFARPGMTVEGPRMAANAKFTLAERPEPG